MKPILGEDFLIREGLNDYKEGISNINFSQEKFLYRTEIILNGVNMIKSERFGILDFSKSDEEFKEKNMIFFEELEKVYNVNILTNNTGDIDYYALIQFFDKNKNEYIIPLPVFEEILHLNYIDCSMLKIEEYFEENGDEYYEEFQEYMHENFNLTVDDFDSRYDWDENGGVDLENEIEKTLEKLKNGEQISQDESEIFIYNKKGNKESNGFNEEIFDYGIPVENFIKYIFKNTYYNGYLTKLKKSQEFLGEELRKFYKTVRVSDLKDYSYYGNLSEWAREYASDELENRFEKIEFFKAKQKEKSVDFEFIGNGSPDMESTDLEKYKGYIRKGQLGGQYINGEHYPWNNEYDMVMKIYYKDTPENEAEINK